MIKKNENIRFALPKGRMREGVFRLLGDAGVDLRMGERAYRPSISIDGFEVKLLKPQSVVEMLHVGSRDLGFAGADWVAELGGDLVELLDTGLDPVRVVAAAPPELLEAGRLTSGKRLLVASEYERLTRRWICDRGITADFVRTYGATEVFPPEDADCIVDNTATGSTLEANGLSIVEVLMPSSTRLYANPRVLDDTDRRSAIENVVLLLRSVIDARRRVMLEVNVVEPALAGVIAILPCMREPTVSPLHTEGGFAVRAAVPREALPALIPRIKASGGTDVVITALSQIVP